MHEWSEIFAVKKEDRLYNGLDVATIFILPRSEIVWISLILKTTFYSQAGVSTEVVSVSGFQDAEMMWAFETPMLPLQIFPSPVNPKGHGPQAIVWSFFEQVTFGKQESALHVVTTTSQSRPVKPATQLHV